MSMPIGDSTCFKILTSVVFLFAMLCLACSEFYGTWTIILLCMVQCNMVLYVMRFRCDLFPPSRPIHDDEARINAAYTFWFHASGLSAPVVVCVAYLYASNKEGQGIGLTPIAIVSCLAVLTLAGHASVAVARLPRLSMVRWLNVCLLSPGIGVVVWLVSKRRVLRIS